jgi:hypothetical protein
VSFEKQSGDRVDEPPFVLGRGPAAVAGEALVDGRVHQQPYLVDGLASRYAFAEGGAVADTVHDPGDRGGALSAELFGQLLSSGGSLRSSCACASLT